eukprot:m51a1_g6614 putative protein sda1 homolog (809) ;mRNA; r:27723-30719
MVTDLAQLQGYCKRDAQGYREEFLQQHRHFLSRLEVFLIKPPKGDSKDFNDLVNFLSQVAPCYPKELAEFPQQISGLLEAHINTLEPPLRKTLVQALILLRSREMLSPTALLSLFFKLFRCHDKYLRKLLHKHIVSDIKSINKKKKDNELNRTLVNFMYTMLQDPNPTAARKSLEVMVELYRKRVWNDPKTVNVIATGVFSKCSKIVVGTLRFFLDVGAPVGDEEDTRDEDFARKRAERQQELKKEMKKAKITRKTRKKKKEIKELKQNMAKPQPEDQNRQKPNWPAIELIHDPHGYAKKVLAMLRTSNESFDVRVMMMNFISRLITAHKVVLLGFYPFMQRYLRPRQEHASQLLAITAQACHDMVPPDALEPVIKTLADEFVNDRSSEEVMAIGMNTVRAICERCPLVMNSTLLRDLVAYKKSHNKAVVAASRSLLQLYREVNPTLLRKKDRGKVSAGTKPKEFGASDVLDDVEGIELLRAAKAQMARKQLDLAEFDAANPPDSEIAPESSEDEDGSEEEGSDMSDKEVEAGEGEGSDDDGSVMELEDSEQDGEGSDDEDGEGSDDEEEEGSDDDDDAEADDDDDDDDDDDEAEADDDDDDAEDSDEEEEAPKGKKRSAAQAEDKEPHKKKPKTAEAEKPVQEAKPEQEASAAPSEGQDNILSQEDLRLLRILKKKASEDPSFRRKLLKGATAVESESESDDSDSDAEADPFGFIGAEDIEPDIKKRLTREERIAIHKENQAEFEKHKIERGRSEKVRARAKPFAMVIGGKRKQFVEKATKSKKGGKGASKMFRGRKKKMFGMKNNQ